MGVTVRGIGPASASTAKPKLVPSPTPSTGRRIPLVEGTVTRTVPPGGRRTRVVRESFDADALYDAGPKRPRGALDGGMHEASGPRKEGGRKMSIVSPWFRVWVENSGFRAQN